MRVLLLGPALMLGLLGGGGGAGVGVVVVGVTGSTHRGLRDRLQAAAMAALTDR
jgi:hypothetical protein